MPVTVPKCGIISCRPSNNFPKCTILFTPSTDWWNQGTEILNVTCRKSHSKSVWFWSKWISLFASSLSCPPPPMHLPGRWGWGRHSREKKRPLMEQDCIFTAYMQVKSIGIYSSQGSWPEVSRKDKWEPDGEGSCRSSPLFREWGTTQEF